MFFFYGGFCIFSTDVKGHTKTQKMNVLESENVIKNWEHGFLLLFIITHWSQKEQEKIIDSYI